MARYIVNSNEYDGHHEVHNTSVHCDNSTYPKPENQVDLGEQPSCSTAIVVAKNMQPGWQIDGCAYCTNCHTR